MTKCSQRMIYLSKALCIATFMGLGLAGCIAKKGKLSSVASSAQSTKRTWIDTWRKNRIWLERKYTTESHRAIIDQVFAQAFEQLNVPRALEDTRTKVFVLNSLPGTGKTQFVADIARALDIKDSGFFYKELSENDRYIDSSPVVDFAIDSQELKNPNFLVLPRIVMFDEFTHAMPLRSIDTETTQELQQRRDALKRQTTDIKNLYETLRKRQSALEQLQIRQPDDFTKDKAAEIKGVTEAVSNLTTLYNAFQAMQNEAEREQKQADSERSREEALRQEATTNLRILWGALGSGSFQTQADDGTRKNVQQDILALNQGIAASRDELLKTRAEILRKKADLEKIKSRLLGEYASFKKSKLDDWTAERTRLIDEARKVYDLNFKKRSQEWEDAAGQAQRQSASRSASFQLPTQSQASAAMYGPDAPTAQALSNLGSLGPKPVYNFREPDNLPERPVFDEDLIYLGSKGDYTGPRADIERLQEREAELEDDINRWTQRNTSLMARYLAAYPGALARLENDLGQQGGIDIDAVIRKNTLGKLGVTEPTPDQRDEIARLLQDATDNWRNLAPEKRLLAIFTENPTRFFQINDQFIKPQSNATNFQTGHIILFLASNVFYVQNEALKLFPSEDVTYPICDSEAVRAARGTWPRLPDYRDPECLRVLVQEIAETQEAKQAMSDSLFGLFGAKAELLNKNIPALRNRLGGAPIFFPPPGAKDYGNFVDFELERVRTAVLAAAAHYQEFGGNPPEIVFTERLRQKLYQDRIDANAGYRGLQNVIGSVVSDAVQGEVLGDLLTLFQDRPQSPSQDTVRKRQPALPKQVVFDFDPQNTEILVTYDKSKKIQRRLAGRFVSKNEAVSIGREAGDRFAKKLSALWLAGEISLTSLLFESLPGVDITFTVDALGVQERVKQQIPEWSLDSGSTNWAAEADNILAHFGGAASMIVLAPYVAVLPESESRYATAETLIVSLHKKLRAEALKAPGPDSNDQKIDNTKNILSRIGNGYLLQHPVYEVLLKQMASTDLSPVQIAEVKKAALAYMVQYAMDHQALIEFVARRFLDVISDAEGLKKLSAADIKNALLQANDLVASTNILPISLLNKLQSDTVGVTMGTYDRTTLLEDVQGMRSDTTSLDVNQRGMNWQTLNPMNIFNGMNRSLSRFARRVAEETEPKK